MAKILVTGGAGFVGSNLCTRLVQLGHKVVSVDNYFTGSVNNHVDGVTYYGENNELNTMNISILDFVPEYIYHLGEYSRVEQSFDDFDKVWEYNVQGTIEVIKFAKKHNAKLIYAGSSTKFGSDGGANSSPYAFTKSTNTQLVQNFAEWYGLDYAITYFYNVYGKNEIADGPYSTLIAKFNTMRKQGKALTVVSPGTQERNFTHVDDIVDGLILVGFNGQGDGYGIGSPETFTVLDVAQMFKSEIEFLPARKGNRMSAEVITEKTRELGWVPRHHLRDFIEELIRNG
jgi:UDP-glucose 4-epimerase